MDPRALDRRTEARRSPPIFVGVLDGVDGESRGRIRDLSSNGAQLITTFAMKPGDALTLRIETVIESAGAPIVVRAVCRWSMPSELPGYHENGLQFADLDEHVQEALRRRIAAATL